MLHDSIVYIGRECTYYHEEDYFLNKTPDFLPYYVGAPSGWRIVLSKERVRAEIHKYYEE